MSSLLRLTQGLKALSLNGLKTNLVSKSYVYGVTKSRNLSAVAEQLIKEVVEEEIQDNSVEGLNMSPLLKRNLNKLGVKELFSIQTDCFSHIVDGKDLVGRARTGTGKTLAFALPIIEKLERSNIKSRTPRVLILAPTRELASQVEKEITKLVDNAYSTLCIYGGAPYGPQENKLKRGVDIVVGTPGRVQDMINKKSLNLQNVQTLVLDEADHMLDIGFAKELDDIIQCLKTQRETALEKNNVYDHETPFQFLLFSATLPHWIKKTVGNYLKRDYVTVDHVGNETMKASKNVKQLAIPTKSIQIPNTIGSLLQTQLTKDGRCVVFCQTKHYCDELANSLNKINGVNALALHGDVSQTSREIALANFKSGKITCLVATDVAARGLDISNVELVIQTEPPTNPETFIHRSGRTGRAGNFGTNVMLYHPKNDVEIIKKIEQHAGIQFAISRAPTQSDFRQTAINEFIKSINQVKQPSNQIKKLISSQFNNIPENIKNDPEAILTYCFEVSIKNNPSLSGNVSRSLLDATDGQITLLINGINRIADLNDVLFNVLKLQPGNIRPNKVTPLLKGSGLVFDVSYHAWETILEAKSNIESNIDIQICEQLPELVVANQNKHQIKNRNDRGNRFSSSSRNDNSRRFESDRSSWKSRTEDRFGNRNQDRFSRDRNDRNDRNGSRDRRQRY